MPLRIRRSFPPGTPRGLFGNICLMAAPSPKSDLGGLAAERCAIDREADTVEPLVHLGAVLTHALADDVQRDLEIDERATGDTREDGEDVVARELVAPEVEALAAKRPGSSRRRTATAPM